jgi:hypothetical protein
LGQGNNTNGLHPSTHPTHTTWLSLTLQTALHQTAWMHPSTHRTHTTWLSLTPQAALHQTAWTCTHKPWIWGGIVGCSVQANEFTLKITPLNSSGRAVDVQLTNKTGLSSMEKRSMHDSSRNICIWLNEKKGTPSSLPPSTHTQKTFKY